MVLYGWTFKDVVQLELFILIKLIKKYSNQVNAKSKFLKELLVASETIFPLWEIMDILFSLLEINLMFHDVDIDALSLSYEYTLSLLKIEWIVHFQSLFKLGFTLNLIQLLEFVEVNRIPLFS